MTIISIINSLVLFGIAGLHIYWALGGGWAADVVLPTIDQTQQKVFKPSPIMTLAVALGLSVMSIALLNSTRLIEISLLTPYNWVIIWTLSGIFLVRAIGDFKYVGLTKQVKNTNFARQDTRYYTPLCIWLSLSIGAINIT
jgi:hypothetical protein